MSKAIIAAGAVLVAIAGLTPTLAQAHRIEGAYGMAPPPSSGCFVTTDRVKGIRSWDPLCRRWGSGIRPGVGEGSGILEGD